MSRLLPWLAVMVAWGVGSAAESATVDRKSAPRPIVALLGMGETFPEEAWSEAEQASRAEFLTSQMDVWFLPGQAEGPIERVQEMHRISAELDARCVLRINRDGPGSARAALLIRDPATSAALERTLEMTGLDHPKMAAVAALRVLETCRSGWEVLHLPPPSKALTSASWGIARDSGWAEGKEEVNALTQSARRPFTLGMGGGLAGTPQSGVTLGTVNICLDWALQPSWELSLDTSLSVVGRSISGEEGRASIHLVAFRAWAAMTPRLTPRVHLALGPGAGMVFAWTRGASSQGYLAQEDDALLAYVGLKGEIVLKLSEGWSVRWGMTGGILSPQVRVAFGDKQVAGFGRPLLESHVRVGLSFPQRSRG